MTATFNLTLDTTGPGGVAASINSGATYAVDVNVLLAITTTDTDTTGYQVKIWGDVDTAFNANIQATEGASSWITLATPHAVKLSSGDGAKNLTVRLRDDVWNESATASDSITLDTTAPTINVTAGPTPTKISKIATKDVSAFSFSPSDDIVAYKVKVVPSTGSLHTAGTQIPTTAGSTNMSGGAVTGGTTVSCTINGTDLETASAGDGPKIVKVFGQDAAGNWSVA
jgi:hypothetical protein